MSESSPLEPRTQSAEPSHTLVVDALPGGEAPPPPKAAVEETAPPPPVTTRSGLSHLGTGLHVVLGSPRVVLFLLFITLLAAAPAAFGVYHSALEEIAPIADFGVETPAGEKEFDFFFSAPNWVFQDWQRFDGGVADAATEFLTPLLLLASWLGLLVTAGWMGLARLHGRDHGLVVFLRTGGRYFFPFLRTWILGMAVLFGVTWLVWETPGEWVLSQWVPDGDLDRASSETTARWIGNGREVVYVLLVLFVEIWLDLARASMVVGQRRIALSAMFRGLGFFLSRPIRSSIVVGAGFVVELAWVAGVLALVATLHAPVWLLVILLPVGRIALRGARFAGLASLYGETRSMSPATV